LLKNSEILIKEKRPTELNIVGALKMRALSETKIRFLAALKAI